MDGNRLKYLRVSKKLTQEELGRRINVSKVSISGYENGTRSPDIETLKKLARFFDCTVDFLLAMDDGTYKDNQITVEYCVYELREIKEKMATFLCHIENIEKELKKRLR